MENTARPVIYLPHSWRYPSRAAVSKMDLRAETDFCAACGNHALAYRPVMGFWLCAACGLISDLIPAIQGEVIVRYPPGYRGQPQQRAAARKPLPRFGQIGYVNPWKRTPKGPGRCR